MKLDEQVNKNLLEDHSQPMPFDALTKIEGPLERHVEQLWDEIKALKKRVTNLEKTICEKDNGAI